MKVELTRRLRGPDMNLDPGIYDTDHPNSAYLRDNLDELMRQGAVKHVEDEPAPVIEAAVEEAPEIAAEVGRKKGRRPRRTRKK